MMFHEASHIAGLVRPFRAQLDRAFEAAGGEAPDRLWHDMIFYTTGEIVRLVLESRGQPGYRHYGATSGVYARGERWAAQLPAFREHWRPFLLSGAGDPGARRRALEGVARALVGRAGNG